MKTKETIREADRYHLGNLNREAATASFHSRRREPRLNDPKMCAYSFCESLDGQRMTVEEGEVYCINRSQHGILVLMGGRPQKRQLLELHVAENRWDYFLNLYEVQWTKVVPVDSQGELFLVGCRLVFRAF